MTFAQDFRIRCSAIRDIMADDPKTCDLTPNQSETLAGYEARAAGEGRKLTDNQVADMYRTT